MSFISRLVGKDAEPIQVPSSSEPSAPAPINPAPNSTTETKKQCTPKEQAAQRSLPTASDGEVLSCGQDRGRPCAASEEVTRPSEQKSTSGLTTEQVFAVIFPSNVKGGSGGHLIDIDDVRYLDMVSAWGANLLGYGYPRIAKAMSSQACKHANLGLWGPAYRTLQDLLLRHVPCAEVIWLLKNGSDATAAAVRLARYATGREKILHRGYHGAQDWYMASNNCPGVPKSLREKIISLTSLDCEGVRQALAENPGEIACLILDPFCWPIPDREVMLEIQDLVRRDGALLIFDEVVSGLRAAIGGMQEVWGVIPDLACFGKGLANGMPLSVLLGREQWMRHVWTINYSLTYGLEAMSIVAAIETIQEVSERDVCADLARKGRMLKEAYADLCKTHGIASAMIGHDSRPQLEFFDEGGLQKGTCNYLIYKELAQNRICTYGTFSLCYSHTDADVRTVIRALDRGLQQVRIALDKSGHAPAAHERA
jgi:glutamate-1-semialdehyde 2,1-aminomutase